MAQHIKVIDIQRLLPHENKQAAKTKRLAKQIYKDGGLFRPLLADARTLALLDGHHRLGALKLLRCARAPVLLVDYHGPKIRLFSRRKKYQANKAEVISRALSHKLYPIKTTRHLVVGGRIKKFTPLLSLKSKN